MRRAVPSNRGWQWPGLLFGMSLLLTALGLVLHVQNRGVAGTGRFFDPVMPAAAVAFPALGAFVAVRRPGHPLGWISSAGILLAAAFFAEQYAVHAFDVRPQAFPGGTFMQWLGGWLWVPGYLILWTLLPLLFPDGRPPSSRWRPLVVLVVVVISLATVLAGLRAHAVTMPAPSTAAGIEGLHRLAGNLYALGILVLAPLCWAGLLSRHVGAAPEERSQVRWPVVAAAVIVAVPLLAAFADMVPWMSVPLGVYQTVGAIAVSALPAVAVGAAVRHRLWGLDVKADTVVNRLLVHGSTVAVGTGGFVVGLYVLESLVPGQHRFGLSFVTVLGTVVALVLLQHRLQRLVDRLFSRTRRYDAVLRALGECLQSDVGTDALLPTIVEVVAVGLQLPYVAVTVGHDGRTAASATYGQERGSVEVLDLVHRSESVGRLVVSPRSAEEPFDVTDRRLLDSVAGQVAVVAHALCLSADLQRSRERLVVTREEERRRLRRDLHDGLQPALAGVALGLEAVRNVVGPDNGANELLGRLSDELQTASADVRRLVYNLRPAELDHLGLVGALRQQAVRFSLSPAAPDVVVNAGNDVSVLPAAVEVAAYRICQEALENVRKHAEATTCEVKVALADDTLHLEVRDDGAGFPATVEKGVGLVAMRERAAELGGRCTIEASSGEGTSVRVVLPLR